MMLGAEETIDNQVKDNLNPKVTKLPHSNLPSNTSSDLELEEVVDIAELLEKDIQNALSNPLEDYKPLKSLDLIDFGNDPNSSLEDSQQVIIEEIIEEIIVGEKDVFDGNGDYTTGIDVEITDIVDKDHVKDVDIKEASEMKEIISQIVDNEVAINGDIEFDSVLDRDIATPGLVESSGVINVQETGESVVVESDVATQIVDEIMKSVDSAIESLSGDNVAAGNVLVNQSAENFKEFVKETVNETLADDLKPVPVETVKESVPAVSFEELLPENTTEKSLNETLPETLPAAVPETVPDSLPGVTVDDWKEYVVNSVEAEYQITTDAESVYSNDEGNEADTETAILELTEKAIPEKIHQSIADQVVESIVEPGVNANLRNAMNLTFYALFIVLFSLLVASGWNLHVFVIFFMAITLFALVNWFIENNKLKQE